MQSHFRLEVHDDRGTSVIALRGELDLASSGALEEELTRVLASGSGEIVIDLRELEFMDSMGLGALIGAHRRAQEANRPFSLVRGCGQVQRLLELTSVAERMTFVQAPDAV